MVIAKYMVPTVSAISLTTVTTYICSNQLFKHQKKVRNTSRSALILFLVNPQDSEVSKMVSFAIVARLDPTH